MKTGEKYDACVGALKEFAEGAGFTDVVIGLSGGMDSTLVAAMCADAFGAERVHGVLLPGPYSSEHSVEDARELADNLGIRAEVVSICEPFEAFERVLARACGGELKGLAAENTQARCRMVCLMALSNAHGWMLVNTGNKSEAMMGYSTLYGDTAGAFAPIGGLYKSDVYAVARWRNERAEAEGAQPPIPERVFAKPPSAELSPDQEDEKSMGIDYDTLDKLLFAHIEQGLDAEGLVRAGFAERDVERVLRTVRATAFKRALEPPSPDVEFYG
ncbi:NAD(+) synthase [Arabiibacter massiliensis]|uniref:NAD(+) synthase n=1 Tax=Arabiibacter massiliensis TaxID=1870985 RepID=UPI0009B9B392|nr:NAD(+) synthase [Arabiibacter massiliensis]